MNEHNENKIILGQGVQVLFLRQGVCVQVFS